MKLKIKEKTALLDQMMFGNVQIVGFDDLEKLEKSGVIEQTTAKVKYITATGQEFTRLLIERDGVIDRMIAGSKLIKGKRIDYCNLSVSVGNKETGIITGNDMGIRICILSEEPQYKRDFSVPGSGTCSR